MADEPTQADKPCPACVKISALQKTEWFFLLAGIGSLLIAYLIYLMMPTDFSEKHLVIKVLCLGLAFVMVCYAILAAKLVIWGERYWLFWAKDHEGRRLPFIHIHRERPEKGLRPGGQHGFRGLSLRIPGNKAALTAAKIGYAHPAVLEVDGPWISLATGWLARPKQWHASGCMCWRVRNHRVHAGHLLLIQMVSDLTDCRTQLEVRDNQALDLLGGRVGQESSSLRGHTLSEILRNAQLYAEAAWEAGNASAMWQAASATLVSLASLAADTPERLPFAQQVREQALNTLKLLQEKAPAGNQKACLEEQINSLEQAFAQWDEQHGAQPKPPRARRGKTPGPTAPSGNLL